jgi:hypothetical protein
VCVCGRIRHSACERAVGKYSPRLRVRFRPKTLQRPCVAALAPWGGSGARRWMFRERNRMDQNALASRARERTGPFCGPHSQRTTGPVLVRAKPGRSIARRSRAAAHRFPESARSRPISLLPLDARARLTVNLWDVKSSHLHPPTPPTYEQSTRKNTPGRRRLLGRSKKRAPYIAALSTFQTL